MPDKAAGLDHFNILETQVDGTLLTRKEAVNTNYCRQCITDSYLTKSHCKVVTCQWTSQKKFLQKFVRDLVKDKSNISEYVM